jgi:hypothetical protein
MAHYAFLHDNGIVTDVITGRDEYEMVDGISDWESHYGNMRNQKCVRTSYNANIRGKFAAIGDTYDPVLDMFIAPEKVQPYILEEEMIHDN